MTPTSADHSGEPPKDWPWWCGVLSACLDVALDPESPPGTLYVCRSNLDAYRTWRTTHNGDPHVR